jgi:hypothetical protein
MTEGLLETTSAAESLWLDTAPGTERARLVGDLHVDVAVLGGGVAGLTAALLVKRDGARVAVLEAARVGNGVTGCTTAKVSALQATIYSTIRRRNGEQAAAAYGEASLAGVERLAALAAEEAIECALERRAAYTYAAEASERSAVEQEMQAAARAGLTVELVDAPDVPYRVHGAVRLGNQVQIHPVSYVQGLAAAVDGDGSRVFEQSRAVEVEEGAPASLRRGGPAGPRPHAARRGSSRACRGRDPLPVPRSWPLFRAAQAAALLLHRGATGDRPAAAGDVDQRRQPDPLGALSPRLADRRR